MAAQNQAQKREFEQDLRRQVRGEVYFDLTTRGLYATDASHYQITPMCVVVPADQDDVIAAVRVAGEHGVPVTPRGGGTSLSGQTHGPGMVLDVSKSLAGLIELNVEERWARVEPGMVRDTLNDLLKPHGLHFAPDPATGNRATIGGMIGNNSSGTRSIRYGKTGDNVLEMKVVLSDGAVLHLGPKTREQWSDVASQRGRAGEIYRGVGEIVRANREEIAARFPKVMRRVSGYALDAFLDEPRPGRPDAKPTDTWNLSNLIVGSEGTLATVLEVKINLDPLPKATALCVVHFNDLIESLRAVAAMLEHRPSTVELLDDVILDESLRNLATRRIADFIDGVPKAVQIVEFDGETQEEADARAHAMADDLKSRGFGYAWPVRTDPVGQANVWNVRKLGFGLISNVKGPKKGQEFVEDACVPIEVMPQYVERVLAECHQRQVPVSCYAHSSVGVIHIRPMLDLHLESERQKMREIAEAAFGFVMEYGGAWAGEHGDGLVRGEFIRRYFGEQIYDAFRQVKALFDPQNLMNPNKIIDPPPMTENFRYGQPGYNERIAEVQSNYHYRDQGGFALAVEQCNGVGACRKIGSGTMCPSYMATKDEEASTRGRANALRLAMSGQLGPDGMTSERVHEVLDLCLQCKACKAECPNAVDMSRMKSDFLQRHHDAHGTPLGSRLMGESPRAARLVAGPLAPIVNWLQSRSISRWAMEKMAGVDRRRVAPRYANKSMTKLLSSRRRKQQATEPKGRRVVLFNDTYSNYYEPHIGVAAVELLEGCGYEVIIANAGCCQRPRMSKGLVRAAKRDGEQTLRNLDEYAKQDLPILCLEPSCASAIGDDLPDLIEDEQLGQRVGSQVKLIDVFLAEEMAAGRLQDVRLSSPTENVLVHGHCHQKALHGTDGMKQVMQHVPGLAVTEVDSGCCGMAGSFGYEHYDVSMKIGEQRLFPAVRATVGSETNGNAANGSATAICANGFSCRHQIFDACGVMPKHWVELVRAESPTTDSAL